MPSRSARGLIAACLAAGVALVLLPGCLRYEESLVIADARGAGTLRIVVARPDEPLPGRLAELDRALATMLSQAALTENLPTGVRAEYATVRANDQIETHVTYAFDDIEKLLNWAAQRGARHPLSTLSVVPGRNGWEYTRRLGGLDPEWLRELQPFAQDCRFTFSVRAPGTLAEHNATKAQQDAATWELTAVELFATGGQTLRARFADGATAAMAATLVGAVAFLNLILLALWMWRRRAAGAA